MIGGLWKSTGSAALLTAAGLYLGSAGMAPAQAADLGGDCCADLEERVAELEATTARKGNRRVSLTISGQVTTSVMYWNDGNDTTNGSDVYIVDNVLGGGTTLQFAGSARINPNVTAGFQLAFSFLSGSRSHQVNQRDDDAEAGITGVAGASLNQAGDTAVVSHLSNWWIEHKSIGRLTVGRTNTATAGLTTIDLGGAGVIANASIGFANRGFFLAIDDTLQSATWNNLMGGSTVSGSSTARANAVMYTSPTVGGFSFSAAAGEDNIWDAALRYAGEWHGFRVAAGIGYAFNHSGTDDVVQDVGQNRTEISQWKGSASVLHVASGVFLTGAFVDQDNDIRGLDNTTLWYLQGGISKNWTGLGNSVLYAEYAQINDSANISLVIGGVAFTPNSTEVNMWGIGVVQHIDAAAMELFLAYKHFEGEATVGKLTTEFNDMDMVFGGARIRF
jgi:hypothetical protein